MMEPVSPGRRGWTVLIAVFGPLALIGAGVAASVGWPAASVVVGALLFAGVWRAGGRASK